MVNLLETDKEPEELYTIDIETGIRRKGHLGGHIMITKIKNSTQVDQDNIDHGTWIYEELEEALEEIYNPDCSQCGKTFGEDDRIYYGTVEYFKEIPEKEVLCHSCKVKDRVTKEL